MTRQTAEDLVNLLPENRIYIYGNASSKTSDLKGAIRIKGSLNRDHPLFDASDPLNMFATVVVSYPTLHNRNGPTAVKNWLIKNGIDLEEAK
jgi:hypothetical protein